MIQGFKQAALDVNVGDSGVRANGQNGAAPSGFGQLLSDKSSSGALCRSFAAQAKCAVLAEPSGDFDAQSQVSSTLESAGSLAQPMSFNAALSSENLTESFEASVLPTNEPVSTLNLAQLVGGQSTLPSDDGAELSAAQTNKVLSAVLSSPQAKLPLAEFTVQDTLSKANANSHELGQHSTVSRDTTNLNFKAVLDKHISAKDMGQQLSAMMADKISLQVNTKTPTATIRLDPPDLGKIDLVVKFDNDKLHVQINASSQATRESIQMTSERLRAELVEQNFLHVDVSISDHTQNTAHDSEHYAAASDGEQTILASAQNTNQTHESLIEQELARA